MLHAYACIVNTVTTVSLFLSHLFPKSGERRRARNKKIGARDREASEGPSQKGTSIYFALKFPNTQKKRATMRLPKTQRFLCFSKTSVQFFTSAVVAYCVSCGEEGLIQPIFFSVPLGKDILRQSIFLSPFGSEAESITQERKRNSQGFCLNKRHT